MYCDPWSCRYVRLSRSLRVARPRSNDVRLIVHGTPLVRKSSACEVSQSTVMRRNRKLEAGALEMEGFEAAFGRQQLMRRAEPVISICWATNQVRLAGF